MGQQNQLYLTCNLLILRAHPMHAKVWLYENMPIIATVLSSIPAHALVYLGTTIVLKVHQCHAVPCFLCVHRILPPIKPHRYNWNTFHYQYLKKQIQVNVPLAPLGDRYGAYTSIRDCFCSLLQNHTTKINAYYR